MQNKYATQIVLKTEHVDLTEHWTVSAILNAMQMAADNHAEQLGAGKEHIAPFNIYWVIARTRIDIELYPSYNDTVTIITWPGTPDRVSFPRYFKFEDAKGAVLGTATVKYMLLDMASHAIVAPGKVNIYPEGMEVLGDVNEQPGKIRFQQATQEPTFRKPAYSDIDLNRHMNNTRYAQWVCDVFPTTKFENHAIRTFQINYVSDGIEGHTIALDVQETAVDDSFCVRGIDAETDKIVFESAGRWMPRKP